MADKSMASAAVTEANGFSTVVITSKAQGDFGNHWARNKTIQESDHTCACRFDSASKRLEGLQVNVKINRERGHDRGVYQFPL